MLSRLFKRKAVNTKPARTPRQDALEKADWEAEYALDRVYQQSIYDVAKGGIDRARSRAEFIEKAAAGVATIYTGVLALVFSVGDNPLPLRGVLPAGFLALAIALAMVYLAYMTPAGVLKGPAPHSSNRENQARRLRFFVEWVSASVMNRAAFLRASVVSLSVGVALLPLPLITFPQDDVASEAIAWPDVPPAAGDPVLNQLLYGAQLNAVATLTAGTPETDWPAPPTVTSRPNADLYAIVLEQQVRQAIEDADDTTKIEVNWTEIWVCIALAVVGLGLVVIVPWMLDGPGG